MNSLNDDLVFSLFWRNTRKGGDYLIRILVVSDYKTFK